MKNIILLISLFFVGTLSCYSRETSNLEDSLKLELNSITFADFLINGNRFLQKIPEAPLFMICSEFDSMSFHHVQIIPKHWNSLKYSAEALSVYDSNKDGLNDFGINKIVFIQIYSKEFLNFRSLRIGQNINYIKNQLKNLIVQQIDKQDESELILTTEHFNIVIWHNQSEIQMIRLQRKCQ